MYFQDKPTLPHILRHLTILGFQQYAFLISSTHPSHLHSYTSFSPNCYYTKVIHLFCSHFLHILTINTIPHPYLKAVSNLQHNGLTQILPIRWNFHCTSNFSLAKLLSTSAFPILTLMDFTPLCL